MNVRLFSLRGVALVRNAACALLATFALSAGANAQYTGAPAKLTPTVDGSTSIVDSNVIQAGCSSCGSSGLSSGSSCSACGGVTGSSDPCAGGCYPGRKKCDSCCLGDSFGGRFLGGILECLCCPDPCYEPHWNPVADSAFFVDGARPVTQMRIRADWGTHLLDPDRAEYFWTKEGKKGPAATTRRIDYQELSMYNEAASGNFSFFTEVPYMHVESSDGNTFSKSGFYDMSLGTKSLLLDCELLQLALQFKTFIPIGDFKHGLGVAHVSLEPAFLLNLKLSQEAYIQAQTALWIPIGGDTGAQSIIWHNHMSFNHTLWHPCSNILLVGTWEMNDWYIVGGSYTDLGSGRAVNREGDGIIFSTGPGARLFICEKIDLGCGTAFSLTGSHFAQDLVRVEFRMRF